MSRDNDAGGREWRPIEAAPKDGRKVLLSGIGPKGRWVGSGHWFRGAWRDDGPGRLARVDYWMPLPAPPDSESSPQKNTPDRTQPAEG